MTLDDCKNPDGTYNGVKFLAAMSGLPEAEIAWTAARVKQLMTVERRPREEALRLVKEEAKAKPWLTS
jgi:hypothetical protein